MSAFVRFSVVGAIGAVLQIALIAAMTKSGLPAVAATPVAVEIAILHNFLWHEKFTWRERRSTTAGARLWKFHASNGAVSLVGNTLLMYGLADRLRIASTLAGVIAIAVCALINFRIADRWVWTVEP